MKIAASGSSLWIGLISPFQKVCSLPLRHLNLVSVAASDWLLKKMWCWFLPKYHICSMWLEDESRSIVSVHGFFLKNYILYNLRQSPPFPFFPLLSYQFVNVSDKSYFLSSYCWLAPGFNTGLITVPGNVPRFFSSVVTE